VNGASEYTQLGFHSRIAASFSFKLYLQDRYQTFNVKASCQMRHNERITGSWISSQWFSVYEIVLMPIRTMIKAAHNASCPALEARKINSSASPHLVPEIGALDLSVALYVGWRAGSSDAAIESGTKVPAPAHWSPGS